MYITQEEAECIIRLWARNLIRNAEKQIRWHCLCGRVGMKIRYAVLKLRQF